MTLTLRDLQPNNWIDVVNVLGKRLRVRVDFIDYISGVVVVENAGSQESYELEFCQPIPITERVLAAFGFTELHTPGLWTFIADEERNISLQKLPEDRSKEGWELWRGKKRLGKMHLALHELQNVAYALDKIELELKHAKHKA